jgi:hypothetical protein
MAELTVPRVDFSPLGQLGNVYRKAQEDQMRQQTLASLGQGTDADVNALLRSGDLSLAQLGVAMKNRSSDDIWRQQEAARQASQFQQTLALQKRAADRADDPTPDNFVKDPNAPGGYRPIGPADPAYQARVAAETARAKGDVPTIIGAGSSVIVPNKASEGAIFTNKPAADSSLDDQTTDLLARRSIQGDTKALVGLGRGAQGAENLLKIQRRVAEIAKAEGLDATDILNNNAVQAGRMSESRTLGTKSAHFGVAEKAMEESLPIALEASKAVPRTAFPVINQLILTGKTNVGDPNVKRFLIATDTAAKDYARTINPNGTTRESDIAYARKILSMADGPEAYEAALGQLKVEAGVTKRAIERQKKEVQTQGKSEAGHTEAKTTTFSDRFNSAYGNPNVTVVDGYTIREH